MRPSAAALAAVCISLSACGGGDDEDSPERRAEATKAGTEVSEVIERFERATARRRWETICNDIFAGAVRAQAGGDDCPKTLARTGRGVRRPRIEVREIDVQGARAEARVRTTAAGQEAVEETIELVREDGSWRIAALGGSAEEE